MATAQAAKPQAEQIAEAITNAVMEHRIAPGSKLSEARLADAFGVSRTKIRQALTILAESGLVQQLPHRGAFVASPTAQEAREVFALRRMLEPAMLAGVIEHASARDIERLRHHLAAEKAARASNNRRAIIRLSGDFHRLLAGMCGNRYIDKLMAELCPLTCLVIALYDAPQIPACPEDEHARIVAALDARDVSGAAALMLRHLQHIENALQLDAADEPALAWDKILG